MKRVLGLCGALFLVMGVPAAQGTQEKIDTDLIAKIKAEGLERSKIMWIAHYLTDVYGPRPVGSPNHVDAANWVIRTMTGWGMTNAHLEPFTWDGVGWLPGRATGFITSPVKANLKFEALPWTPSTKGAISGRVLHVIPPASPTDAELTAFLIDLAPKLAGAIVMVGPPPNTPVNFNEPQKRTPDDDVRARFGPNPAPAGGRGRPGGGRGDREGQPPAAEERLTAQQVTARIATLLRDHPPALRLVASGAGRIPGVIVAQNGAGQTYVESPQVGPGVLLRNDDYGRIARLIADGTPVNVEFNVQNTFYPEGRTSYVTVGEIAGTDKADEIVMLGGHLDSWTSATGATDNAIGCAVMLEAMRIIQAVGVKPRRTIRVALWSGEEQGLLGSYDYVKRHFGSAEDPRPDFNKLVAYWNIDAGTGKARGASIFGPPEAGAILAQFIRPFEDWGMYGARSSAARVEGGSDNGAFAVAGLPGIAIDQDNIEYTSTTWHTNLDAYERIVPDDVMKNAVLTASVVLHLANRDHNLPRFTAQTIPPLPAARSGGPGGAGGTSPAPATPHVYLAKKNAPLKIFAPGLLPPAGGRPQTSTTTTSLVKTSSHGALVLNRDGSFVYTPAKDYTGTDTFTYTATTTGAAGTIVTTTAPGTVTVVVR